MTASVRKKQCKACPWRKGVVPARDIPGGYSETKHRGLASTIARGDGLSTLRGERHVMACHETPPGREQMCTGWVVNQLQNNNIGLRMQALSDPAFRGLELDGEQHETFEETLGEEPDEDDEDGYEYTRRIRLCLRPA